VVVTTCNGRFAVAVGANSATPVSLIDFALGQEVDTFAFDGLGSYVAACDDGESVLVVLDNDAGTASVIKRLTIAEPGTITDTGETLALGSDTVSINKVFAVPGSQTGLALISEI